VHGGTGAAQWVRKRNSSLPGQGNSSKHRAPVCHSQAAGCQRDFSSPCVSRETTASSRSCRGLPSPDRTRRFPRQTDPEAQTASPTSPCESRRRARRGQWGRQSPPPAGHPEETDAASPGKPGAFVSKRSHPE